MVMGSELLLLGGYTFDVRYSDGSVVRARAAADVAADAYDYLSRLFSGVVKWTPSFGQSDHDVKQWAVGWG